MRSMAGLVLIGAALLAGCGQSADEAKAVADANANAAGFTPPAVMSRIDFGSSMDRRFRQLDLNTDDRLTPDELPRRTARLRRLDKDGNGSVSPIEFSEGTLKRFDAMDLNHDSTVTSEEHQAWRDANRARGDVPTGGDSVGDALENRIATPD
ncbi:hypothetical protein [Sphingomonas oligophenolica]|nr:hypothetical protein [Sphingomonas oligophenolica]